MALAAALVILGNVCEARRSRGDLDRAGDHYKKALSLFEKIGAQSAIAQTQQALEQLRKRSQ